MLPKAFIKSYKESNTDCLIMWIGSSNPTDHQNQTHAKIKPKIHSSQLRPTTKSNTKNVFSIFFLHFFPTQTHEKSNPITVVHPDPPTHANSPITTQSNFYKQTHIWECFKEKGKKPSNILQSRSINWIPFPNTAMRHKEIQFLENMVWAMEQVHITILTCIIAKAPHSMWNF